MANTSTMEHSFTAVVNERHAVKHYDPNHRISRADLMEILEMAGKAPSSWNLQHWKFLVIEDPGKKQALLPIANNQKQVVDASVVVAVLGDLEAHRHAEPLYSGAVKAGAISEELKNTLVGQIQGVYKSSPQVGRDEAIRNASLAAMQLMLAAKAKGYDTCPMGGYNPAKLVEEFHIPSRYLPIMLVTIGKALKPAYSSPRFKVEEITVWNGF
ncbi:nitroreductase family protein [Paenibacillus sp. HJGM_3]|uniref:nitroreductase family protein n=1 Tax=Paenibacillus sp. HJGM_3 TaxID=3379816 RepID=UPI0038583B3A